MTLHDNPPQAHFPQPPRLLRRIRNDIWDNGKYQLQENPHLHQTCVHTHHYHPADRWEFWVIRDPNQQLRQRTVHNGRVEEEVPWRY